MICVAIIKIHMAGRFLKQNSVDAFSEANLPGEFSNTL